MKQFFRRSYGCFIIDISRDSYEPLLYICKNEHLYQKHNLTESGVFNFGVASFDSID